MASERRTNMGATLVLSPYDAAVAMASEALTGITIYASFKALYLEVILDGFGSDVAAAQAAGVKFLQAMEAKAR